MIIVAVCSISEVAAMRIQMRRDGKPIHWSDWTPPHRDCKLVAYSQPIAIMLSKTADAVAWSPSST